VQLKSTFRLGKKKKEQIRADAKKAISEFEGEDG